MQASQRLLAPSLDLDIYEARTCISLSRWSRSLGLASGLPLSRRFAILHDIRKKLRATLAVAVGWLVALPACGTLGAYRHEVTSLTD